MSNTKADVAQARDALAVSWPWPSAPSCWSRARYAYDTSRDDLIAEGVTVAGVDVGGLQRARGASSAARRACSAGSSARCSVAVAGQRFRLTAERAAAGRRRRRDGRRGGRAQPRRRCCRCASGAASRAASVQADVEPRVELLARSRCAGSCARCAASVNRPPRDADVKFETASLPAIPSQTGLRLRRDAPAARRRGRARARSARRAACAARSSRSCKPKVTTDELAEKYPYVVTVDRAGFRLRYFKDLKLDEDLQDRGRPGRPRDAGRPLPRAEQGGEPRLARPEQRLGRASWPGKVIPGGVPENPLKSRWLGIYDGAGIHGTADVGSLGTAASHGCIRMAVPDVEELYDEVPVQTPVFIQ